MGFIVGDKFNINIIIISITPHVITTLMFVDLSVVATLKMDVRFEPTKLDIACLVESVDHIGLVLNKLKMGECIPFTLLPKLLAILANATFGTCTCI